MKTYVAIDGGGSGTRCAIADESTILAQCEAPVAKPLLVGTQQSAKVLFDVILQCCALADVPYNRIRSMVIGMAGVWEAHEVKELGDQLYAVANAQMYALPRLLITSDVDIAHHGVFGSQPGILVVAGTGSMAVFRDRDNKLLRCGGYGPIVGDEGSGTWISQRALTYVLRCCDGRERPGPLFDLVRSTLALDLPSQARDLALLIQRQELRVAEIAPLVFQAAIDRDRVALDILHQASIALVELAEALARTINVRSVPVSFVGSIAEQPSMRRRLLRRLDEVRILRWMDSDATALDGAIDKARSLAGSKDAVSTAA